MNVRGKFALGAVIILGTLAWLGWVGTSQSKTYYHTISELQSLQGRSRLQRMRVSGNVEAGSIQHLRGRIDFVLGEQGQTLNVSYVGRDPLPDTFKDGAQALVEGRAMPDGRFIAEQVQAKCASKYAASPNGAASALTPNSTPSPTTMQTSPLPVGSVDSSGGLPAASPQG